jgi:undecaprenol kinase
MKNRPFRYRVGFAIAGILAALRTEHSFRTQVFAAVAVLGVLAWLRPAPLWWAIIVLTIVAVLGTELLNTAVERLADHLHPEAHPGIKAVKDCAAAAVFIVSLGAVCVAVAFVLAFLQQ